jgi:predicted nucleotide-binding protein (sugar kinase/HSP70/actin superfamily)
LELGNLDKARKEIETSNIDATMKAQIADIFSNIDYRQGQLAISNSQLEIQRMNAETARISANKEGANRANQDALDEKRYQLDARKVDLAEKELNAKISGNNYDVSAPQLAAGIRESFNVVQYDYATGNKVESFDGAAAGRYIDKLGSELNFPPQLLKETRAMVGILPPQKSGSQATPIRP